MRELSKREKDVIRNLITKNKVRFTDFFSQELLAKGCIELRLEETGKTFHDLVIRADPKIFKEGFNDYFEEFFEEIMKKVALIDLLLEKGYIFPFALSLDIDLEPIVQIGKALEHGHDHLFGDKILKQKILKYRNLDFYPSQELKAFVRRGFLTEETASIRKSLKVQQFGIYVALASSVIGIVLNLIRKDEILINEKQLQEIIQIMEEQEPKPSPSTEWNFY